jgi:FkbM family methyltransferase
LEAHPGCGLIDLGANIGTYTLIVASMGRNVIAVEPNLENVRRIHKAVSLGGLAGHVTVMANAMSNERGMTKILLDPRGNIGANQFFSVKMSQGVDYSGDQYFKSITMDDLLPFCKFKMAVIKIDIEGAENRAFAAAGDLFDNIDIPYVQMEWFNVKANGYQKAPVDERNYFNHMITFLVQRRYIPLDTLHGHMLNLTEWKSWPFDVAWVRDDYID